MSGRSCMPPPHHQIDEPPLFARVPPPHPHLLDDLRPPPFGGPRGGEGSGLRSLPHPVHIIEERLAVQQQEIQSLLVDNQRLAATHASLKQEVAASQHELQRLSHAVGISDARGSAAATYGVNYANPDPMYGGNPYPAAYTINPQVPGNAADGGPQYGGGAGSVPTNGSWGSYDTQCATHVCR